MHGTNVKKKRAGFFNMYTVRFQPFASTVLTTLLECWFSEVTGTYSVGLFALSSVSPDTLICCLQCYAKQPWSWHTLWMYVTWIHLAQNTNHSWAVVSVVSEILDSIKDDEFVNCCGISNFSRTALLLVGSLLVCLRR